VKLGFRGHPCAILLDRSSDAQRLDRSLKGSLHFPRTGFLICVRRKRKREQLQDVHLRSMRRLIPRPNVVRARCSQFRADRNILPD